MTNLKEIKETLKGLKSAYTNEKKRMIKAKIMLIDEIVEQENNKIITMFLMNRRQVGAKCLNK